VARYAGNPDIQPSGGGEITATEGSEIFAQAGCGSCHVFAAAGSSGTVGPNLDETQPSNELVVDRVTNGQGAMPSFADQLSEEQIQAVADFVAPPG
jgi:mono/diheme cytochrome c family protein